MYDIVVVSVTETKNIYYLEPNSLKLKLNDMVIFESDIGLMNGIVIKENYSELKENLLFPLFSVVRIADKNDLNKIKKNKNVCEKALIDIDKFKKELNLDMQFVDSYLNFDSSQLIISFLADDRIDFRDLVKKMAQKYIYYY